MTGKNVKGSSCSLMRDAIPAGMRITTRNLHQNSQYLGWELGLRLPEYVAGVNGTSSDDQPGQSGPILQQLISQGDFEASNHIRSTNA